MFHIFTSELFYGDRFFIYSITNNLSDSIPISIILFVGEREFVLLYERVLFDD